MKVNLSAWGGNQFVVVGGEMDWDTWQVHPAPAHRDRAAMNAASGLRK